MLKSVQGKKRNTPPFIREAFKDCIRFMNEEIDTPDDIPKTIVYTIIKVKELKEYVEKFPHDVSVLDDNGNIVTKSHPLSYEDFVIKVQLKEDPIDGYDRTDELIPVKYKKAGIELKRKQKRACLKHVKAIRNFVDEISVNDNKENKQTIHQSRLMYDESSLKKYKYEEGDYVEYVNTVGGKATLIDQIHEFKIDVIIDRDKYLQAIETVFRQLFDCFQVEWNEWMDLDRYLKQYGNKNQKKIAGKTFKQYQLPI